MHLEAIDRITTRVRAIDQDLTGLDLVGVGPAPDAATLGVVYQATRLARPRGRVRRLAQLFVIQQYTDAVGLRLPHDFTAELVLGRFYKEIAHATFPAAPWLAGKYFAPAWAGRPDAHRGLWWSLMNNDREGLALNVARAHANRIEAAAVGGRLGRVLRAGTPAWRPSKGEREDDVL